MKIQWKSMENHENPSKSNGNLGKPKEIRENDGSRHGSEGVGGGG